MGLFHLTICDNVNAIRRWHDKKHQGPWFSCCWEPCSETEEEFRRLWS